MSHLRRICGVVSPDGNVFGDSRSTADRRMPQRGFRVAVCMFAVVFVAPLLKPHKATAQEGTNTREELVLREQMPSRVSGAYVRDGISLDFDAVRTDEVRSLVLRSGSREVLLDFRMDLRNGRRTVSYFGGRMKIEADAAFVAHMQEKRKRRSASNAGRNSAPSSEQATAPQRPGAQEVSGLSFHGDNAAIGQFAHRPEYQLLPYLSVALGQRGITGNIYPATLTLHLLGMLVAEDLGVFLDKQGKASEPKGRGSGIAKERCVNVHSASEIGGLRESSDEPREGEDCRYDDSSCDGGCSWRCSDGLDSCGYYNENNQPCDHTHCELPRCDAGGGGGGGTCCSCAADLTNPKDPCRNDCLGMCGSGCSCWPFVCGDCAAHFGCEMHDDACRQCQDTYGLNIPQCVICYTPLAVIVAEFGC